MIASAQIYKYRRFRLTTEELLGIAEVVKLQIKSMNNGSEVDLEIRVQLRDGTRRPIDGLRGLFLEENGGDREIHSMLLVWRLKQQVAVGSLSKDIYDSDLRHGVEALYGGQLGVTLFFFRPFQDRQAYIGSQIVGRDSAWTDATRNLIDRRILRLLNSRFLSLSSSFELAFFTSATLFLVGFAIVFVYSLSSFPELDEIRRMHNEGQFKDAVDYLIFQSEQNRRKFDLMTSISPFIIIGLLPLIISKSLNWYTSEMFIWGDQKSRYEFKKKIITVTVVGFVICGVGASIFADYLTKLF